MTTNFFKYSFIFLIIIINLKLLASQKHRRNNLQNYWSFSQNLTDEINKQTIIASNKSKFAEDRFGKLSAFCLNGGYAHLPSFSYLKKNFTISLWVKIESARETKKIITFFLNEYSSLNLKFESKKGQIVYSYLNEKNEARIMSNVYDINPVDWFHVALVQSEQGRALIYLNATLIGKRNFGKLESTSQESYIGRNNTDKLCIDDLKIFNKSLRKEEIINEIVTNCSSNPCNNGGVCRQNSNNTNSSSISCTCKDNYIGTFCDFSDSIYVTILYKVVIAFIVLAGLLFVVCIVLYVIKCTKFHQINRDEANSGFTSPNSQVVYSVNGRLNRTASLSSFDSALRNSTKVEKTQNEYRLPSYDEYSKTSVSF